MSQAIELADQALRGSRRALARLITLVEDGTPQARTALAYLYEHTGRAHVIGVTGSPGSGKSTLVNELAKRLRRQGRLVGIIAVDPSSPFSGGAVLGDRIRMQDLAGDQGIFIRSMASRGSLGGLARSTGDVIKLLDAAGYESIIVETVGAGQSEVDIARAAHTTIVVQAPGMGDDIQAIKAGILEIADVLVVNKADRPGAEATVKALQLMQRLGQSLAQERLHHGAVSGVAGDDPYPVEEANWEPPIVQTVGTTGEGVDELMESIAAHMEYLDRSGGYRLREAARIEREFRLLLQETLLQRVLSKIAPQEVESLVQQLVERTIDPFTAVENLVARA